MKITEIEKCFKLAVEDLYENDKYLLSNSTNIHEQSISHRLAVYLEKYFVIYKMYNRLAMSVDCEYNKNCDNKQQNQSKIIYKKCASCPNFSNTCFIKNYNNRFQIKVNDRLQFFKSAHDFVKSYYENDKASRPDILVHKRGNNKSTNKLIVEVKKTSNPYNSDKIVDQIKLSYFTCINSEYKYKIGYYLEYSDSKAKILQFVNGKIQTIMGFNAVNKSWYPIIE